jgi:hypothetical protein
VLTTHVSSSILCKGRLGRIVDELMKFEGNCSSPLLRRQARKAAAAKLQVRTDLGKANARTIE